MTRKTNDINNCMNNDNALMMEALRHGHKKVLVEGDEFEDDFFSPGISKLTSKSPYIVRFFAQPGNPKGIITHDKTSDQHPLARRDNKAKFWKLASKKNFLYNPYFGTLISGPNSKYGPSLGPDIWVFYWDWMLCKNPYAPKEFGERWAKGFIEGEDFIFESIKRDQD